MSDDPKPQRNQGDARGAEPPTAPVESEHGAQGNSANARKSPSTGERRGTLRFLRDLNTNERLTAFFSFSSLIVAIGALSASVVSCQNASDTSEIRRAIAGLTDMAKAANRQADAISHEVGEMRAQTDILREEASSAGATAKASAGQLKVMTEDQRARIALVDAEPITALRFLPDGAHLTVTVRMTNTGHGVAEFAYPFVAFIPIAPNMPLNALIQRQSAFCAAVRKGRTKAPAYGMPIFPGRQVAENAMADMSAEDVRRWKDTAQRGGTAMLLGCIDYVAQGAHHQTWFASEVDRLAHDAQDANPFRAINPADGDVAKADIALAVNPAWAGRSD